MRKWSENFLKDCKNFVQIGDSQSEPWTVETGAGQGRRTSPDFYNLATMSLAIFAFLSEFFGYADDGIDVIHGDSAEECNAKLRSIVDQRSIWYRNIGLALNIKKTEIMGFNFVPESISIENHVISAKSEIKFLGITIQNNLKWTSQVNTLCDKITAAAYRIRNDGRHLCVSDRRILYNGWIQGPLLSNGLVFLPTLNESESRQLQTACNNGVRAIMGLPRYGYIEISALRRKLNIPSISALKDRITSVAAWKKFHHHKSTSFVGPTTRSREGLNLPVPDQRGHLGKLSSTTLTLAWNKLDTSAKQSESLYTIKKKVKELFL